MGRRLLDITIALKQDSLSLTDLTSGQVQDLEGIADSATMWAQRRAQSWLNLYDDRRYTPDYIFIDDTSTSYTQRRIRTATEPFHKVSPNPANHQITLSFNKAADVVQVFSLIDVTGRTAIQKVILGKAGSDVIDIHQLSPGMYLYKITENGNVLSNYSIVFVSGIQYYSEIILTNEAGAAQDLKSCAIWPGICNPPNIK